MVTVNTPRGFTLVELLITMVVLAIVVAVAIPPFSTLVKNNRSIVLAEEFNGALQFARAEAVKRRQWVSVCASSNGSVCSDDWSKGFIVVVDGAATEGADAVSIDSTSDILKVWDSLGDDTVINAAADVSFLRYTSTGRLAQVGTPPFSFKTSVIGCKGDYSARVFSINLAGSISVTRLACPQD